jgi:transcription termination/antitermination protein NusA
MNTEIFDALNLLEKERGISADFMIDRIKKAIVTACKSSYGNEDCVVNVDPAKGAFEVYLRKTVVEDITEKGKEITVEKARELDPAVSEGDKVAVPLDTKEFGRIAAQTARNIIRQGIRDGERDRMLQEFESKHQELVSAVVEQVDPRTGAATLSIGKAEAVLPKSEQVAGEVLREGDHVKVYVADVKETEKGPRAIISRIHPDLVKRLFEAEVPEIYDGTVEIRAVSREAGSRTKIAVLSHNPDVDAVGSCIGSRGMRVNHIVSELSGEKIDIVEYSDDPQKFIASALSPASVLSVTPAEDGSRACRVTVPDDQLSLAIGNKGQNARLAARLTGWKIDIKPRSGFFGDEEKSAE